MVHGRPVGMGNVRDWPVLAEQLDIGGIVEQVQVGELPADQLFIVLVNKAILCAA